MVRVALIDLLLLLAPTLAYFAYIALRRRGAPTGSDVAAAPFAWLVGLGVALLLVVIVVFIERSGGRPGQAYTPPVLKDGVVQPGTLN